MLKSQAILLHQAGELNLEKAKKATKLSDVKAFTEMGLKCLGESREILEGLKRNSILTFFECCARLEHDGRNYGAYLDFCARNGLDTLSEVDFEAMAAEIFG